MVSVGRINGWMAMRLRYERKDVNGSSVCLQIVSDLWVQCVICHDHSDVVVAFTQESQVHQLLAIVIWTAA